jgi:heat-inducible transcriptional repressor
MTQLSGLSDRARQIFRLIVEGYLETGDPVGSKALVNGLGESLSSASIRSTMAELENLGLLYAPHVSAGRLPTEQGLRLFVDGLLQVGELSSDERADLAPALAAGQELGDVVTQAVESLTGLSQCASLVVVPNQAEAIKHIEFVPVSRQQLLVVLVDGSDRVENRLVNWPEGITHANLVAAGNYLNARLKGRSLDDLRTSTEQEIKRAEAELDALSARVIEAGLAEWGGVRGTPELGRNDAILDKTLIVRGQANLLNNLAASEDLERIRILFDDLERKKDIIGLLSNAEEGSGVRIFIGSENKLFSLSGSSLIVSGYRDKERKVVGVLGVIAPTRSNYARLIPLVDHTARLVSRALGVVEKD